MKRFMALVLFYCLILASAPANAGSLGQPLLLVSSPALMGVYGRSVLAVAPFGVDQHVGFIVNRPSGLTLGRLFPGHGPSQRVTDPVFFGGPFDSAALFALVAAERAPGKGCIELMPGLFAAYDAGTIDGIIERNPDDVRYLAGLVAWRPGELQREIDAGAWYVMVADPSLAMREPDGLWEELVARAQLESRFITAAGPR